MNETLFHDVPEGKRMVMQARNGIAIACMLLGIAAAPAQARTSPDTRCLLASGKAGTKCVKDYAAAVGACRDKADAACETALRGDGGTLDGLLAATEKPTRQACSPASADKLTFSLGVDDLVFHTAQACEKWAEDFLALAYADDLAGLSPSARVCQRNVAARLRSLRDTVVQAYGRKCYVPEFAGKACDRPHRDALVAKVLTAAGAGILKRCGATFDELGLSAGPTLEERIDALLNQVRIRAQHLAQRVYPPMNLGPTGLLGPHPVGVRTLDLVDPSRPNPVGAGSRPLVTEVYYPSTAEAVAGVPRDVLVAGITYRTATYRDVVRAPGAFPLVVYSHGSPSTRVDDFHLLTHLASHGFVVVSAEHPGNNYLNPTGDPATLENRPLDVRFLIDQFLAFNAEAGNFFEGAIDPARIGGSGYSTGGYAVTTLATGPFVLGTFTDPRMKAMFLLDAAQLFWGTDEPAIFGTITIPTLSLGGDSGFSVVLAPHLQSMFDVLQAGPTVSAYGVLRGAGHLTFPSWCEGPDANFQAQPECGPVSLPYRYAQYIIKYLALNFFDATLNGNPEALARLAPTALADIEELTYQSK
jgi:Platelet-activating factor acetylhydrolase, isoform II